MPIKLSLTRRAHILISANHRMERFSKNDSWVIFNEIKSSSMTLSEGNRHSFRICLAKYLLPVTFPWQGTAWPLSRKDVIAENKMAPLLQYFVLMAIIVSIECRKDVFKCSVCGKNLSNLKAERRKFRAVSDDLFACFGPLEEESPHEPGKKFLCGTCRRALADFKRTGKTFFHVSKNAISQQSVTICVS